MNSRTLLTNNQSCLLTLHAGLSWMTDREAQKAILNRFALANMIWENPEIEAVRLQARADQIRPIIEELWKTTQYDYNPIDNYDRKEEYTDIEDTSGSSSAKSSTTSAGSDQNIDSQYPMENAGVARKVSQSDGTSSASTDADSSSSESGNRKLMHSARMHGNIGVTTTQQMIEEQRRILISCQDEFARRFADLFYYEM